MAKPISKGSAWSAEDDDILRRVYPTEGPDGVQKRIEGRSLTAIKSRAKYLSVKLTREALGVRRVKHLKAMRESGQLVQPKKVVVEVEQIPREYIQAADIFQVGYRVASLMGVVHEYA